LGVALLAAVAALAAGSIAKDAASPASSQTTAAVTSQEARDYARSLSKAFRESAEKVLPSVVTIENVPAATARASTLGPRPGDENEEFMDPFGELFRSNPELRRFFGQVPSIPRGRMIPPVPRNELGVGSGVLIDSSGVILTSSHVVDGGGKIKVRLSDGREFEAADVKTDPRTDVAVVRIKGADNLKAAKLGNSSDVDVGDWVLALGGPFGLEGTVTAGIISAKGRSVGITARDDFLQTDAAINPGNSGGPLVNLDGEVIGINTAISTRTGGNMGVGFAVPVNLAKWVADQLVKTGKVQRAYLGVEIKPVDQEFAEMYHVKVHEGVGVRTVFDDTPAAKAGVKPGDVILSYGGKRVSTPQELTNLVERSSIGQKEAMEIVRNGKRMSLEVTADKQPVNFGLALASGSRRGRGGPAESSRLGQLGIEVAPLTRDVAQQLGIKANEGVVITRVEPGSPAALAGLSSGTLIVEANRKPVKTVEELKKAIEGQPLDKGLLLLVRTAEGSQFVVIRVEK